MTFKEEINKNTLPKHIAIIMDGNGRWAKQKGKQRVFGHQAGVKSVRQTVEAAAEIGIKYLTLYAFSTENWKRPAFEVSALMQLLVNTIAKETETMMKNKVKLRVIGDIESLPKDCKKALDKLMTITAGNTGLTLVLALSYSSKWEITRAVKNIATEVKNGNLQIDNINETVIENHLTTSEIPNPELLIRTSGEYRVSNFLLWQIAYSEFYFTEKLWPQFDKEEFFKAIYSFQQRERRFGLTGEQIKV